MASGALGIATCGRFSSLADDLPDALSEMFNVDKKHAPLHRLEASKLVEVWQQAKARDGNTAKRLSRQPEHTECLLGNFMKSFPRPVHHRQCLADDKNSVHQVVPYLSG